MKGWQHAAKPFTHLGVEYPSRTEFCRRFGLHDNTVISRIKHGITDERLTARRIRSHQPEHA